jgi:hypothetical protein
MVADALAVAMNAIEEFNQFERFNGKTCFFAHLAYDAGRERFPDLQPPPRQRPLAFERLVPTAHQQHAALVHDHCAYTDQGRLRELSLHAASALVRTCPKTDFKGAG